MDAPTPVAASPSQDTTDRLAQQLRRLVEQAEEALRSAADAGDAPFDELRTRFDRQLQRLRAELDDLEGTVAHKARQATRAADRTVQAHPYGAMGLAATIGLLAGVLLGSRR